MRVHLSEDEIEVRLTKAEKALGLLRNIKVARSDVSDVQVLDDPLREVMRSGLKVGLRLPWLYYVCRSIRLDRGMGGTSRRPCALVCRAQPGRPGARHGQHP